MSNLSTQVFGDMNYLYEHIANKDSQQLDENSDHYDGEFTELVEDIFYNISYSMASEGYSANGILDFLSKATEEDILEKYFDCTISEGVVSEDYIIEQLQIIDEGIGSLLVKLGRGAVKGTLGFAKRLATAGSGAIKGGGGVRDALGAMGKSTKRAIGQSGAVTKVKDIAKSAKAALTSPTAKKVGLGALGLGAATGAGYLGGKMSGSGGDQSLSAKPKPNQPSSQTPPPAPKLPAPTGNGGGGGSSSSSVKPKVTTKPKETDKGPAGETPMQKWARLHPNLASKVKPGQSGYGEISKTRVKPGPYEKKDQTPTTGPEASDAQKSQAGADVAAIQAKQKAEFEKKQKEVSASTQKESYDLVLEYLFDNGHADTLAEAEYLMTELDESFIQSLVETYHANLLAEEVTAWVNQLVEEGHDLSEYTWDDMVDYYFTESK
jgi:hypothetical protein